MRMLRIIGLILIVLAAGYVTFGMQPTTSAYESGAGLRAAALVDAQGNASNTDNVYQQIVVNGWAAKDLLEVVSTQVDNLGEVASPTNDSRTQYLVFLGVLALCLIGITAPTPVAAGNPRGPLSGPAEQGFPNSAMGE